MKKLTKKQKIIIAVVATLLVSGGVVGYLVWHKKSSFKEAIQTQEQRRTHAKGEEGDEVTDGQFEIAEGCYYTIYVGGDTAFLLVERVDDEEIAGCYYPLEPGSDCVREHKFSLTSHRRTTHLKMDGEETVLKMKADELHDLLDGEQHTIEDEQDKPYTFAIQPYQEPAYKNYANDRLRKEIYPVQTRKDITYGQAEGYWTSFVGSEEESYAQIVKEGIKNALNAKMLDLTMDLYLPNEGGDTLGVGGVRERRPLVLFMHGGAFYVGDKSDPAISDWCRHFAAMGYVAASINYRMGFIPSKKDIARTGYMAIQDAHAAMRYLVGHANEYMIDTTKIFVAGTSAGAITALNLAFMRNANRPDASFGKGTKSSKGTKAVEEERQKTKKNQKKQRAREEDLGTVQSKGNSINSTFHILAVANMWGAVSNLNMLKNAPTAIISFHGDADQLVPYDHGYPFADISERLGRTLFDQMYGSKSIDARARELGMTTQFYTFAGEGHALHLNPDRTRNVKNFNFIRDHMTTFFYQVMVPHAATIKSDPSNGRHYLVDNDKVAHVEWKVEGGFVVSVTEKEIWVVWREKAPTRTIAASGAYANGITFGTQMKEEE